MSKIVSDRITVEDIDEICKWFEPKRKIDYNKVKDLVQVYAFNEDFPLDYSCCVLLAIKGISFKTPLIGFYKRFLFTLRDIKHGNLYQTEIVGIYNASFNYKDEDAYSIRRLLTTHLVVDEDFICQQIKGLYDTIPSSLILDETFQKRLTSLVNMIKANHMDHRNILYKYILINVMTDFKNNDEIKTILYESLSILHHTIIASDKTDIGDPVYHPEKIETYHYLHKEIFADKALFNRIVNNHNSLVMNIKTLRENNKMIVIVINYLFSFIPSTCNPGDTIASMTFNVND